MPGRRREAAGPGFGADTRPPGEARGRAACRQVAGVGPSALRPERSASQTPTTKTPSSRVRNRLAPGDRILSGSPSHFPFSRSQGPAGTISRTDCGSSGLRGHGPCCPPTHRRTDLPPWQEHSFLERFSQAQGGQGHGERRPALPGLRSVATEEAAIQRHSNAVCSARSGRSHEPALLWVRAGVRWGPALCGCPDYGRCRRGVHSTAAQGHCWGHSVSC